MFNPVDRYRVDLTTVVRRLSRAQSNETAIDEMVSHFDGLYQEESVAESNETLAEKNARKRMGSLYKIAFQIVNSPDRVRKGTQMQVAGYTILILLGIAFYFFIMPPNRWWLMNTDYFMKDLVVLLAVGGFIAGLGVSLSKRIAWKPIACSVLGMFLTVGLIADYSIGDFHISKKEVSDLVARQAELDPKVATIETHAKNILNLKNQSPEAWKKEINALSGLVRDSNTPYFKEIQGSSGAYLYPSKIEYPREYSITYSMTLSRTDDLVVAQKAWQKNPMGIGRPWDDIFQGRINSFKAWKETAAHQSTLWLRGFQLSANICWRLDGFFVLFALLGLALGRVRVYGFDWVRGVKA